MNKLQNTVKQNCKTQFINQWDIAVFRGGPSGLLHRTPDEALEKLSILMRLDHESFWDSMIDKRQSLSNN